MVNSHWKKHTTKSAGARFRTNISMSVVVSTRRTSKRDTWLPRMFGSKVQPDNNTSPNTACSSAPNSVAAPDELKAFNPETESVAQTSTAGAYPVDIPAVALDKAFTAEDIYTDVCMSHRHIKIARHRRSLEYCRSSSEGLSEDPSETYIGCSSTGIAHDSVSR